MWRDVRTAIEACTTVVLLPKYRRVMRDKELLGPENSNMPKLLAIFSEAYKAEKTCTPEADAMNFLLDSRAGRPLFSGM